MLKSDIRLPHRESEEKRHREKLLPAVSVVWALVGGIWLFVLLGSDEMAIRKKRCCELDLKEDDIFNKWSPTMTISHAGQDYRMKVHDMTRNFKLTFIWRFNGFKPKESNSIDTSRFGTGK